MFYLQVLIGNFAQFKAECKRLFSFKTAIIEITPGEAEKCASTIIRQICRLHNIPYVSNLTYNHSTYDISYKIYMPYIGLTSD